MTSDFVRNTCLLIRHDGCKKGTYPKGGRCVPARAQQGGGGNGRHMLGAAVLGGLATAAAGAGLATGGAIYANTKHGQRTIGETQQKVGKFMQEHGSKMQSEGSERYAKNQMSKEAVKAEYQRRLARHENKSAPKDKRGISEGQAKKLERMLK